MRDNMEQTEVLALAPEQHQLQQHHHQQASLVGVEHFLHQTPTPVNATTTSSSVAHVKSEPQDEIDEFETSSQHYSSDTTTSENLQYSLGGVMSPGSSRSQDSVSPLIADNNNHIPNSNDEFTHENFITSSKSTHNDEMSLTPLKCPICGFQHQNRLEFTDHLREHCPSAAKIGKEEFNKCVMAQLTNSSSSTNHSNEEKHFDNFDRGIRIPCISSQGKVTTHHCKQCRAIFITKVDKWIHGRTHLRPEKILDCPTCEFCTELKQHLQYHLLNHSGSKPFKCEMCSYECVNKSMLNSHMKSHSDVYQFRCADCPYATKYCYTLKVHLRTRNHRHRMILNPDGTPNPDYVIDVYGTRRGPKSKSKTKTQKMKSENSPQLDMAQSQYGLSSQVATLNQSHLFNPMNRLTNIASFNAFREAGPVPSLFMNFPANQIFNHLSMAAHSFAANQANATQSNYLQDQISLNYMDYSRGKRSLFPDEVPTVQKKEEPDTDDERSVPLNLSTNCKSETARHEEVARYANKYTEFANHAEVSLPRTTGSSRRKGLARRVLKNDTTEEMPEADLTDSPPTPPLSPPVSSDVDQKSKNSSDFICRYCNISFGHEIMHLIHMTYHDDENPFKCKKCGIQTNDSVSFFLHIVSYKH